MKIIQELLFLDRMSGYSFQCEFSSKCSNLSCTDENPGVTSWHWFQKTILLENWGNHKITWAQAFDSSITNPT